MRIALLVEGKTETAIKEKLKEFLDKWCDEHRKPRIRLQTKPLNTRLLDPEELRFRVRMSLADRDVVCVIVLVDVYPKFKSAQEAKDFLRQAVGSHPRFHPHAAQFEFEAWLIPFWDDICKKLKVQKHLPGSNPEMINEQKPPSHHLRELYRAAGRTYDKPRDAMATLQNKDIMFAADKCPELKSLLNTLLRCAGIDIEV